MWDHVFIDTVDMDFYGKGLGCQGCVCPSDVCAWEQHFHRTKPACYLLPFPGRDFISKKLRAFVFLIEKTADPGTWLGSCPPPRGLNGGRLMKRRTSRGNPWCRVSPPVNGCQNRWGHFRTSWKGRGHHWDLMYFWEVWGFPHLTKKKKNLRSVIGNKHNWVADFLGWLLVRQQFCFYILGSEASSQFNVRQTASLLSRVCRTPWRSGGGHG